MQVTMMTGRMYNGAVHGWSQDGEERSCFRGRLNFRQQNGDYAWIDAVCFRDNPNSEANGLVGWLEDNYLDSNGEDYGHGRAVELVGTIRPVTKQMTVSVPIKGGGKKDIPGVKYESFELVIDQASYVPTSQGESSGRNNDLDEEEEFDIDDDALEGDDQTEEEDVPTTRTSRSSGNSRSTGNSRNSSSRGTTGGSRSDRRGTTGGSRSNRSTGGNRSTGKTQRSTGNNKPKKEAEDEFFVD